MFSYNWRTCNSYNWRKIVIGNQTGKTKHIFLSLPYHSRSDLAKCQVSFAQNWAPEQIRNFTCQDLWEYLGTSLSLNIHGSRMGFRKINLWGSRPLVPKIKLGLNLKPSTKTVILIFFFNHLDMPAIFSYNFPWFSDRGIKIELCSIGNMEISLELFHSDIF